MEDIDTIIKQRREIEELEERKKVVFEELDKVLDNITAERRKFEQLGKDKEKFLLERQKEAVEKVAEMSVKIKSIEAEMGFVEGAILKAVDTTEKTVDKAVGGIVSIFNRSQELLDSSKGLKEQYKGLLGVFEKAREELEKKIINNSEIEKQLKEEKIKVEKESKIASEKLKEAQELAFWHKEPGAKYTK